MSTGYIYRKTHSNGDDLVFLNLPFLEVFGQAMEMVIDSYGRMRSEETQDRESIVGIDASTMVGADNGFEYHDDHVDDADQVHECLPEGVFEVILQEGGSWTERHERAIAELEQRWPQLQPRILDEVFALYREVRADFYDSAIAAPSDAVLFPEPLNVQSIINLFRIEFIGMNNSGHLALVCSTVWTDEYNMVVRLLPGNQIEIGFSEAYQVEHEMLP